MKESLLGKIKNLVQGGKSAEQEKKSAEWFRKKLTSQRLFSRKKESAAKTFERDRLSERNRPLMGRMYLFYYDAKHKDTLPFWDAFPLIILVGTHKNGFQGLNLHYLPPSLRAKFLSAISDTISDKYLSDTTKFNLTYGILKNTEKYKYFKPCFKSYLTSQVKTEIKEVHPEEWINVVFLKNALWQKAAEQTVYRWSRSQIK